MTCRPSLVFLLAVALAGCGSEPKPGAATDWRAMLARGDGAAAEIVLRRALDAGAQRPTLAPYLGEAMLLQGDLAAAREWLEPAIFAPDVAGHGFRMLGRLRMQEGKLAAAGQAFDRSLAIAPNDPELWVDIGRLRWIGGEQAQAVAASRRARVLGPQNAAALLFRAQLARDATGHAAALPILAKGLERAPDSADLLAEYAATTGELGRGKDMLAAVRRMPPGPRAFYLQAVLVARAGQYDLARGLLHRSGNSGREMPAAMLLEALIDLENGNFESAAHGFERLLRRQPDNRRVRLLLARSLALGGNYRELIARFGKSADSPYLAMLVGRAHEALGDRDLAAPYLDRAITEHSPKLALLAANGPVHSVRERTTEDGPSAVAAVRALIAAGQLRDARAAAAAFLRRQPGSADAMALAGDAALAAGDNRGALDHYRLAASIRRPWALTKRMVFVLDRLGDRKMATALLKQHLDGEPGNIEARDWLSGRSTS